MSAKTDNNAKDRADADELAVILAKERLVENKPCPVCGSVEHPHPASDRAAAQTELGRAENNADEKRKKNEKARGSFFGISLGTSKADIAEAILEGICFEMKDIMAMNQELSGEVRHVRLCGGVSSPAVPCTAAPSKGRR